LPLLLRLLPLPLLLLLRLLWRLLRPLSCRLFICEEQCTAQQRGIACPWRSCLLLLLLQAL
jgi:hypothetical protein